MPKARKPSKIEEPLKIAIVGTAGTSNGAAPYDDHSWKIWSMARNFVLNKRFDAWFELHGIEILQAANAHPDYFKFLKTCGGKLMLGHPHADYPDAMIFPKDKIVSAMGDYFTSSCAWMIALAILHKPAEIGIWGVDMIVEGEYCVSPDTKVLTDDLRWVPVGEVEIGDNLIGFDENVTQGRNRNWRRATVEKADRITRPCYRVFMGDGTEIVCSSEHRWLTLSEHDRKWRRTDELVTHHHRNDRPTKIIKLLNTWREDNSWEAGYLAAAFDGEGHLEQCSKGNHTSFRLGFSQRENAMSEAVKDAAARLGYRLGLSSNKYSCKKYVLSGGRAETIKFLGQIRPRRLLEKFDASRLGALEKLDAVDVRHIEFLGEQPVIGLKTSTGTFIAEGFASHNSHQKACCEYYIGYARALGIKVYIAPQSPLARSNAMYAFDNPKLGREMTERMVELERIVAQKKRERENAEKEGIRFEAQLELIKDINNRWQL